MHPNTNAALEKENILVDLLAATAAAFAKSTAENSMEADILNAWAADLLRHKEVNETYQKLSDSGFDSQADEELEILKGFRATLAGKSGYIAKCWNNHFEDDINLLASLK